MRPRDHAQAIIDRKGRIEDVPAEWRDLVCSLLEEFNAVVWCRANTIRNLATKAERRLALWDTPEGIRESVKSKVLEFLVMKRDIEKSHRSS